MADIIDQVQEWNELHTRVCLLNQSIKAMPEQHPDFDGEHCVEPDCGIRIPRERLLLGRVRCFGCQDLKERRDDAARRNGRAL